jgi:hypothetical protein
MTEKRGTKIDLRFENTHSSPHTTARSDKLVADHSGLVV